MGAFRGSDEALDREIATLERIGRVRLRRSAESLSEIDRDLRELRREQAARRRARATAPIGVPASESATV
ncbi:MAG TPA: hypothetical protein VGX00_03645 [Thermoplasmata archaeon]|nr:hypothetical protein [Thermoplasmata archaeon]